jgi:pimeloyl-ACP methyl ester carboxylesterase
MGLGVLFGLLYVVSTKRTDEKNFTMGMITTIKVLQTGALEYSVNGDSQSVAYYHCASDMSPEKSKHLVLLHGAHFTKEDWKTSGILDTLCENPNLSVSAMDLSKSAGHDDLMGMLLAMKDSFQINLPVALVTPSASGMTITDWMATGDLADLPNFVQKWIPVACGKVKTSTEDQLARMARLVNFEVFAIYGDKDRGGREVTERLEHFVGAKTLELEGGHPCYLDSPEEFCSAVVKYLGI